MSNSIGLYIHIPFCKSKCPYCDFFSGKGSEAEFDSYCDILIKSIKLWGEKVKNSVSTIYFGGGTPSIIGTERLCKILSEVKESFLIEDEAEITVEINPESGKKIDFNALKGSGFNRISIGLQSAVKEELKALGRIHSIEDVTKTIANAHKAKINNISLDLMLGIPNQTIDSLKQSVNFCNSCGVTHISSYILKIEDDTYFYKIKDRLTLPNEDEQAELYLKCVDELNKLGFEQYEISNFAKKGYESKHNINYWKCGEYIGIGPSAHSFYNGKRFYYNRKIEDFKNNLTVFDCIGGNEEEYIMLCLRLKSGLKFDEYQQKFDRPIPSSVIKKAEKYEKYGYLTMNKNKIALTAKGFLISNAIISDLMFD